jgi:hypothetical protein
MERGFFPDMMPHFLDRFTDGYKHQVDGLTVFTHETAAYQ